MEAGSDQLRLSPRMDNYYARDSFPESASDLCQDFGAQLKLVPSAEKPPLLPITNEKASEDQSDGLGSNREEDDDEEIEDDFSFVLNGDVLSLISAEEIFENGQIRPIFPLFNRDLLDDPESIEDRLPLPPPLTKVFIEAPPLPSSASSSSVEYERVNGIVSGPYCAGSKGAEPSPDVCKKSNSTGFSKLWRFRDFLNRSNSDGRDAFVFLDNSGTENVRKVEKVISEKAKAAAGRPKDKVNGAGVKAKVKKGAKAETSSLSAYMKSRASEEERRRSYLPYRPELVGFFTNVNGGLSRNVHPF